MNNILRQQLLNRIRRMSTINLVDHGLSRIRPSLICAGLWKALLATSPRIPPAISSTGVQRRYSQMIPNDGNATSLIDSVTFEVVCSDTLESLCDYFDDVIEETNALKNADVTYGDGVLTIKFGPPHGTYVINRQSPNRQIWLSSPTSGPKRYDFIPNKRRPSEGCWLYRHDGVTLHELLQHEISVITGRELNFLGLPYSQLAADDRDDG